MGTSEERIQKAADLSRIGTSYLELLERGHLAGLAARPALSSRIAALLRLGESLLLVGRPGSGRRSLVRLAVREMIDARFRAVTSDLDRAFQALVSETTGTLELSAPGSGIPFHDIVEVPVTSFQVEAYYVGDLESKVAFMVEAARTARKALFLPDFHLACTTGASSADPGGTVANLLLAPVRDRRLILIASTTPEGLRALRMRNADLLRHLVQLDVPDADAAEAERLLLSTGEGELPHGARLAAGAAAEVARLGLRTYAGAALPGAAFDLVRETAARMMGESGGANVVVQETDLLETYRLRAGLRPEIVHADRRLTRADLDRDLGQLVIGQPEAVDAVSRLVLTLKAGLVGLARPIGTFLFAGPTGVGKTHLAQCLAEYLFGSARRLVRFDMGEYGDTDAVRRFVGGDSEHSEAGLLAQLRGAPFAVLLLDEIEKAHPRVRAAILSLLDEGTLTDYRGAAVSCQNTIILLTTNVGAELYRRNPIALAPGAEDGVETAVRRQLEREFPPEFLNRMNEVVVFRPLDEPALRKIARQELAAAAHQAEERGLTISLAPEIVTAMTADSSRSGYGAREIRRTVRRRVVDAVAERFAATGQRRFHIEVADGVLAFRPEAPRVSPSLSRAARIRRASRGLDDQQAREVADRVRTLRAQLIETPDRSDCFHETARALVALGRTAHASGRPDLARKFLAEALQLWTRLIPGDDCPPDIALDLAAGHLELCVLARDAGEEGRHLVSAVRLLGRAPGAEPRAQRLWADARQVLGHMGAKGN